MNKIDRVFWTKNTTEFNTCCDTAYAIIFLRNERYYAYNDNKRRGLFNRAFYKL